MLLRTLPVTCRGTLAVSSYSFITGGISPHLTEPCATQPRCSLGDVAARVKGITGTALHHQRLRGVSYFEASQGLFGYALLPKNILPVEMGSQLKIKIL